MTHIAEWWCSKVSMNVCYYSSQMNSNFLLWVTKKGCSVLFMNTGTWALHSIRQYYHLRIQCAMPLTQAKTHLCHYGSPWKLGLNLVTPRAKGSYSKAWHRAMRRLRRVSIGKNSDFEKCVKRGISLLWDLWESHSRLVKITVLRFLASQNIFR